MTDDTILAWLNKLGDESGGELYMHAAARIRAQAERIAELIKGRDESDKRCGELLAAENDLEWLTAERDAYKRERDALRALLTCVQREINAGRGVSEETATAIDRALVPGGGK
jgi:hypothetical protein